MAVRGAGEKAAAKRRAKKRQGSRPSDKDIAYELKRGSRSRTAGRKKTLGSAGGRSIIGSAPTAAKSKAMRKAATAKKASASRAKAASMRSKVAKAGRKKKTRRT